MDEGNVSFEDWTYLQKCLKYEKIRVNHGEVYLDENEKKDLLNQLENLLKEYYSSQLIIRESQQENSSRHKRLVPDAHSCLGDNFRYAEQMVFIIRSNPEIFNFISQSCRQPKEGVNNLVESFGYSFFLDLIHPENTELELVNVMHRLINSELRFLVNSGGNINNLLSENFVLKNMMRLYMRRKNQRKYMKLVFRKPLREIIHDQETMKELKLEPKAIYKTETERMMKYNNEDIVPVQQKKKSFFGSSKKPKPVKEVQKVEVSEEEALSHPQVKSIIEARSEIIINHCKSLLNALYKNVRTMPFGLRGICKRMIDWIQELYPDCEEKTIFNLLGIFLFTSWWIPAIIDPIKSGLLQNVIINPCTLGCLKTIATILKNLFKESYFEEPHFFVINRFINEEKDRMKQFFREIIQFDESTFTKTKSKKSRNSVPALYDRSAGTMCNYFLMTSKRVNIPQFSFNSQTHKQMQHMNEMKEFRITTVMLALEEIKFLSKLFEDNEAELTRRGWSDLLRYSKNLRAAEKSNTLIQYSFLKEQGLTEEDSLYLLFINKKLGPGIDSEVVYTPKHNFSTNPEENKLLTKVIDATRNLVTYLDMSIFFDPGREWSLIDVVEFVIQFSYLFENKKMNMQTAIPMKLLAQFLAAYLKTIPQAYTTHNFRKLYTALIKDYEERFEFKRRLANRNKKLLLLAVNFMEKHITEIKQEIRVFESVKRKEYFLRFIKKGKVPACLLSIRDGNNLTIQVFPQSSCPHSKLASVNEFVMGSKKTSKSGHPSEATHVNNIEEFYQKFMKLDQVVQSTEREDDPFKVGEAFFEYMNVIKNIIFENLRKEDDTENTCEEIEKYITSCMYNHIFPSESSIEDTNLHRKSLELDWIKPEHLDIVPANRNEDMWKLAIEAMESMETYRAPAEKLNCLLDCMSIIVNVLTLVSAGGGGVSTDDSLPIIIYVVIKAKPTRLYSNLNYISKFRHSSKMIGLKGFVFQQFQSAAAFVLNVDYTCLSISLEEYEKNVKNSRVKHGIVEI